MRTHNHAPTITELRKILGKASSRSITQFLKALERKGYIVRSKYAHRGITLVNDSRAINTVRTLNVPVVAYAGCDDGSVFADEIHDEFIPVDSTLLQNKSRVLAVRAKGSSMSAVGINDGDYVLIEETNQARNGENVAAVVDGMLTIKQLERRPGVTILHPRSKDDRYRPIVLREDFAIVGRVLTVIPVYDTVQFVPERDQMSVTSDFDGNERDMFSRAAINDAFAVLPAMSREEYEYYQNL